MEQTVKPDQVIAARFDALAQTLVQLRASMTDAAFQQWVVSATGLVERVFGLDSPHAKGLRDGHAEYNRRGGYGDVIAQCVGPFEAAKDDSESGALSRTRSLLRAEVSEDVLAQAEELLEHGYKDPACVLAGVTLEVALRDLCEQNSLAEDKLDRMNADLAKADVYNKGLQKQITAWAHWRNKAAHGEWDEYNKEDVKDMISGVRRFVGLYLS